MWELTFYRGLKIIFIWKLKAPGFTYLAVQLKQIKDRIYTPMGGWPTLNGMFYAIFGSSPKPKI